MDDDKPMITTFKELKKKKLHLSEALKEVYDDGLKTIKAKKSYRNDPRFDPRINGVCHLDDWKFLEDEQKQSIQKLKKILRKEKHAENRESTLKALNLLKQRIATDKDRKFRKEFMNKIKEEQSVKLQAGERVVFMKRANFHNLIEKERLEKMNKRNRERYLNRKKRKRPHSAQFDD